MQQQPPPAAADAASLTSDAASLTVNTLTVEGALNMVYRVNTNATDADGGNDAKTAKGNDGESD
eukprot:3831328-Rhodomonas_salina.1